MRRGWEGGEKGRDWGEWRKNKACHEWEAGWGGCCLLIRNCLYRDVQYSVQTVLYFTALHSSALDCNALYCTALHCTALHCTALHSKALQSSVYSWITESSPGWMMHSQKSYHTQTVLSTSIQCKAVHFTALNCSAVQCDAVHCSLLPYNAVK